MAAMALCKAHHVSLTTGSIYVCTKIVFLQLGMLMMMHQRPLLGILKLPLMLIRLLLVT